MATPQASALDMPNTLALRPRLLRGYSCKPSGRHDRPQLSPSLSFVPAMISVKSGFTASPPCIDVAYSSITSTLLPAVLQDCLRQYQLTRCIAITILSPRFLAWQHFNFPSAVAVPCPALTSLCLLAALPKPLIASGYDPWALRPGPA